LVFYAQCGSFLASALLFLHYAFHLLIHTPFTLSSYFVFCSSPLSSSCLSCVPYLCFLNKCPALSLRVLCSPSSHTYSIHIFILLCFLFFSSSILVFIILCSLSLLSPIFLHLLPFCFQTLLNYTLSFHFASPFYSYPRFHR
jgi:hypothetical protein